MRLSLQRDQEAWTPELWARRSELSMRLRRPLARLLDGRIARAAASPHSVDDYLSLVDATWSLRTVRARVVEVRREEGDATSLFLAPNEVWKGFVPGQYVRLSVRANGVHHTRCYSLSSSPHEPLLRLTLKHRDGGRVSAFARDGMRAGQVVELSQALGDFTLGDPPAPHLLLVAGGSGITPMRSMIRHLNHTGYQGEVTCLHFSRGEGTFGAELRALSESFSGFTYVPLDTARHGADGQGEAPRLCVEMLERHAPAFRESEVYVCGPEALEEGLRATLQQAGVTSPLHAERFVAALSVRQVVSGGLSHRVQFERSGKEISASDALPLLVQAEEAGLSPASGCRMGICHTCKCLKRSGVVRNELTGEVSDGPDEEIRLCVSAPCSDLVIDL